MKAYKNLIIFGLTICGSSMFLKNKCCDEFDDPNMKYYGQQ